MSPTETRANDATTDDAGTGDAGTGDAGAIQPRWPTAVPAIRAVQSRTRRRVRAVSGLLVLAVGVMFGVNVLLGDYPVAVPDLVRILAGEQVPGTSFIVWENKLPRAVTAVLVGGAFGVSGAVFQTMLRNPLASPDVIGVTAGASAAAVLAIVVLGLDGTAASAAAVAGAVIVALGVQLLSGGEGGGAAGQRLVLVGIGFAAVLQAVTGYLLTGADIRVAADALVWLSGSLNASTWPRVAVLVLSLLVLLPLTAAQSRRLLPLELGEDLAAGLGVRVRRTRLALLLTAVALAAVATAAAGPIAFVAFVSGPLARRLLGGRVSLPTAGLVGSLVVLGAEFVAANLVAETVLPVGVVTGALGAPFLLYLLVAGDGGRKG